MQLLGEVEPEDIGYIYGTDEIPDTTDITGVDEDDYEHTDCY